jgi:hypothetical protein
VCLNTDDPVPPMSPPTGFGANTDDFNAVFYVDFSNAAVTTSAPGAVGIDPKDTAPELHVLSYEPANQRIVERDYKVTAAATVNGANTYTYPTFTSTPARFKVLLSNVVPYRAPGAAADTPVFTYYKFTSPPVTVPPTLPTPTFPLVPAAGTGISVADTAVIAKVAVAYRSLSDVGAKGASTVFHDDVYVRAADPNDEAPTPTCA